MLLLDADEDCAAQLGPNLDRALSVSAIAAARPVRAVVAVREFETWILGGVATVEVADADALGAAKDRLRAMHGRYRETADQARLIAAADLDLVRTRSRSFQKLLKTLDEFRDDAALPAR